MVNCRYERRKNFLDEKKDLSGIIPSVNIDKASSGRVDINVLISRVRLEKQKENKTTLVFLRLIISLFLIWNYLIFLITYFRI